VLAITSAVQSVVAGFASRERPYGRVCGDELPEESRDCRRNSRHRSFFSGHTSIAFAAAGLSCTHHMNLGLYGGGGADAAACGASLLVAASTGALRMAGDVHYATDVGVGAIWGSLAGFGLPWLLHYKDPIDRRAARRPEVTLTLVPVAMGAGLGGTF
jgi:membrane-associated phospholipid phosphatase